MTEPTPTLGEIAKVLRKFKARGVSLDALLWVAMNQVWYEEADEMAREKSDEANAL